MILGIVLYPVCSGNVGKGCQAFFLTGTTRVKAVDSIQSTEIQRHCNYIDVKGFFFMWSDAKPQGVPLNKQTNYGTQGEEHQQLHLCPRETKMSCKSHFRNYSSLCLVQLSSQLLSCMITSSGSLACPVQKIAISAVLAWVFSLLQSTFPKIQPLSQSFEQEVGYQHKLLLPVMDKIVHNVGLKSPP